MEEDLEDKELWEVKDLKIPVCNTKNGISVSLHIIGAYKLTFILLGSEMRELKSSVTRSLCDQIFTSLFIGLKPQIFQRPLEWPQCVVAEV